ncbi:hypothetical protein [Lachnoclostridium sp. Marseille-P6806]|uniref:hypothetical protein n=1 Tax=Lachnoclostridium sp. Marseille-P6806 TaxID=2364793 RepID=UPI001031B68D|nr:hypothetical protein [Lachnoclostridium sp. Marseille-P6806]
MSRKKYPWTLKRTAAWLCIAGLGAMYVITLLAALTARPGAAALFRASLALTVFLPAVCWLVIWLYGIFAGRRTIASLDLLNSDPESRKRMEEELQGKTAAEDGPENRK